MKRKTTKGLVTPFMVMQRSTQKMPEPKSPLRMSVRSRFYSLEAHDEYVRDHPQVAVDGNLMKQLAQSGSPLGFQINKDPNQRPFRTKLDGSVTSARGDCQNDR